MPIFILSLVFQVILVVHIVRTGRNTTWIWIVVMLPLAGSIAYVIVELLPDLMGNRRVRRAGRRFEKIINPDKDLKTAAENYATADTVENAARLAEECLAKDLPDRARDLYRKALRGIHASDPDLMHGLARAEFALHNPEVTRQLLDDLIQRNPDYRNQDAHLLYARALEELGEAARAREEYEALARYYSGAEARYCYARFLRDQGENQAAEQQLDQLLQHAKRAGAHYHEINREWISRARKALAGED